MVAALDRLAVNPRPPGVRKLKGGSGLWRLRVGDYRVIFEIDDARRLVDVSHIRHRREAYE
jgi:mRNA interferase RelE/StbE